MFLRQSTSQDIRFGPCLDITDGVTEETALTLAQADMRLSKDGGAFAQKSAAGNATHDSDGWYSTTLSTTDTDTVGELILNVHQPANMLPVWVRWWVLEEAVYDAMYGASAAGPLQPTTAGRTLDVTAGGAAGIDWGNIENPATAVDLSGTDIQLVDTATAVTNGVTLAAGAITNASLAGNMEIVFETDFATNYNTTRNAWVTNVQDTVGTGNLPANAVQIEGADATDQINAACDASIETYHLDHLLAVDYDPASKPGTATALLNEIVESDGGVSRFTSNALDHALTATGFSTHSAADVRTEVDANSTQLAAIVADTNELQADWADGGRLDLILDARASQTTADAIETDTQDIQSRLPAALVNSRMDSTIDATGFEAAAVDKIFDEPRSGHTTAGTYGQIWGVSSIVNTAVNDASASATSFVTDLTEATDDHYNGRIIVFTSGDLAGQVTDITDYDGTAKSVTVTALTEAPANNDEFVIV